MQFSPAELGGVCEANSKLNAYGVQHNGQRATGNGQRATGNGQRATGNYTNLLKIVSII
jgi:hypothetical protein